MMKRHAVILTKSAMKKNGKNGACTTAYDVENKTILRFVSDRKGSPIPYIVAKNFKLFDIVEINVMESCPEGPQTENVVVEMDNIKVIGQYEDNREQLLAELSEIYSDTLRFLESVNYKTNSVEQYNHSLEIVRVSDMVIKKTNGSQKTGKVSFSIEGKRYSQFRITDLEYDIRGKSFSEWNVGEAFLAVSIPSIPFEIDGGYYKFIAAVYPVSNTETVRNKAVVYGNANFDNLSYSASYSGFSPSFTISGLPENTEGAAVLQHSFTCVIRNILSRAERVEPSEYLRAQIDSVIQNGEDMAETLDTIIRYQFAILALMENGNLNMTDTE